MSPRWIPLFATTLLTPLLSSQTTTTFFAPAGYATTEGGSRLTIPFGGTVGRAQFVLGTDAFQGLGNSATFRSLGLRPDRGAKTAKSIDISVSMSNSFQDFQLDGNMLRHRGPDHAEFFARRVIQLPAVGSGAPVPSPARVLLTLDRPFPWYGGGVCIEVAVYGATSTAYDLDGVVVPGTGYGTASSYGTSCPAGANQLTTANVPWNNGIPIWTSTIANTVSQSGNGILFVGLSNTSFGGIPLPLNLDPILGTVGCSLRTDVVFTIPFRLNGTHSTTFLMPRVGHEPTINGLNLYMQALVFDPTLPGQIGMSNGVRAVIGAPPVGTSAWAGGSPNNTNIDTFYAECMAVEIGL